MTPNPDDIIHRGNAVARLFSEDAFTDAINEVSNLHLASMAAAMPGEPGREARDYHHLLHYALAELVDTLRGYVSAGEEMAALTLLNDEDPE